MELEALTVGAVLEKSDKMNLVFIPTIETKPELSH